MVSDKVDVLAGNGMRAMKSRVCMRLDDVARGIVNLNTTADQTAAQRESDQRGDDA